MEEKKKLTKEEIRKIRQSDPVPARVLEEVPDDDEE